MTMPFIRKNKINPAPILEFSFADFTGGLNNRLTPMQLKTNEAQSISNMMFSPNGGLEKRWGTELYDDINTTDPVVYIDIYKPINASEVIIRATENSVYADDTLIATVLGKIQGANYVGNYYFVDGTNYYIYNGTSVYIIKQPPEKRLVSNVNSGTATLTLPSWDDRIVVGMDVQLEGINGIETGEISSIDETAKTVTLTESLSLNFLANELVRFYIPKDVSYYEGVYQTDETLKWKWYEPCSHELDDDYKGENYIPQQCTCMAYDSQRLFIAGDKDHPNEIYIGDINNPYYFPTFISMQCPPNGDKIKELTVFDDSVIVFRSEDVHAIYGETADVTLADVFQMKKLDTHTGIASANCARVGHDYMFYVGSDMNIYMMRSPWGNNETLSTVELNKDKISLAHSPINLSYSDLSDLSAVFFEDEYMVAISDIIIVYNYLYRSWTIYRGLDASYLAKNDNTLLIGTTDGSIITKSTVYSDRGVAIVATYTSGQYSMDTPILFKDFLDIYVVSHAYDDYSSSLKIASMVDYHAIISEKDVESMLSKFGTATFGSILISNNISQSDNIPVDLRGRTYTFMFGNDILNEPIRIYQVNGTYKVRGVR